MFISYLKVENFLGFKHFESTFEEEGIFGIIGRNMSGKTNIIEAILCALTGSTRYAKQKDAIHYGEDFFKITLKLNSEGKEHTIVRGRDTKNNKIFEIDFHEKSLEGQECINSLIGLTPEEFEMTHFFKAGEISKFMNLSNAEKKKYLMKWFKKDHWEKLEALAAVDKKELTVTLKDINSKINILNELLLSKDEANIHIKNLKVEIDECTKNKSILTRKIEKLKDSSKYTPMDIFDMEDDISTLKGEKEHILSELEAKEEYKAKLTRNEAKLNEIKQSKAFKLYKKYNEVYTDIHSKVAGYKALIKQENKNLINIKKDRSGVCPVLGTTCLKIKPSRKDIDNLHTKIAEYNTKLEKYSKKLNAVDSFDVDGLNTISNRLNILKHKIDGSSKGKEKIARINTKIKTLENKIKSNNPENLLLIEKYSKHLKSMESTLLIKTNSLAVKQDEVKKSLANEKKINSLTKEAEIHSKRLENVNFLLYAFGKNGIPSLEIENGFQGVEDEINTCLEAIKQDMRLQFSPDKELNAWEAVCPSCGFTFPKGYRAKACEQCEAPRVKRRKDEVSFNMLIKDKILDFNGLSSGGKTMVSLAVRTVLSQLLRRKSSSKLDCIFLDEIDAPLDDTNVEYAKDFITNALISTYGYKQVFWVSHHSSIKEHISNVLSVKQIDTVSEATWL